MSIYNQSHLLIRILEFILPRDLTHLIGDLEEEYLEYRERYSPTRAHLWFWFQVIQSTPHLIFESLKWNTLMISNYLKVAYRNISKHKSFSFINVFGLAVSISVCLLIILFIYDQKSYDKFHVDSERIYRLTSEFKSSGNLSSHRYATTPATLADVLRDGYSGIEEVTTIRRRVSGDTRYNDKVIGISGLYTDQSFFKVFSFNLIKGDPATALREPGSIVITEETADKFFEDENPIGKVLNVIGTGDFTVTGVIDADKRTHISFDVLASYSTLIADSEYRSTFIDNWRNSIYSSYTYFKLEEGANIQALESQLPGLIQSNYEPRPESYIDELVVQPLSNINMGPQMDNQLGSVMPAEPMYFLFAFACIIIAIACFNYMGLTIARSLSRSKEVGVRKALGANRTSVIGQFLIEAIAICVLSLGFALGLLYFLIPQFNGLGFISRNISRGISLSFGEDFAIYFAFLLFSVIIGLIAGLFPALHLSSFKSASALKGIENVKGLSKSYIRKGLLVIQFACSIIFIITAILVNRQFNYLLQADYGFDKEFLINLRLQDVPFERAKDILISHPDITLVSGTSIVPGLGSRSDRRVKTDSIEFEIKANYFGVDEHYIENMQLTLVSGRNFSPDIATDEQGGLIISEGAVKALGLNNPIDALDQLVDLPDSTYPVIGVIRDFVSSDITIDKEPIVMQYAPASFRYASIRVRPGSISNVTAYLETSWAELGSIYGLRYSILSDRLREAGSVAILTDLIKVVGVIAFFSIMISCMGLFGMAMFNAESRTKEIGIRKVLGASIPDIVLLLSREYIWLVVIAVLISVPVTYLLNNLWLQEMANRIEISPVVFILGIAFTIILSTITVGSQTLRAAQANSADNLRSE